MGLPSGPHKVLIELVDANHHTLDKGMVTFVVPALGTLSLSTDGNFRDNNIQGLESLPTQLLPSISQIVPLFRSGL